MNVTTKSMPQKNEERALGQVRDRLQMKFGDQSRTDVATVVDRVARRFTSARIRDYVPLLVERISRDELSHRFVTQ